MGLVQLPWGLARLGAPGTIVSWVPLAFVALLTLVTYPMHVEKISRDGFFGVDTSTQFWFLLLSFVYGMILSWVFEPVRWILFGDRRQRGVF